MVDHREIAFEIAVKHSLTTSGGYEKGDAALYDRNRALHPRLGLEFVQTTQAKSSQAIATWYGAIAMRAPPAPARATASHGSLIASPVFMTRRTAKSSTPSLS